jgi:hypothetical protein
MLKKPLRVVQCSICPETTFASEGVDEDKELCPDCEDELNGCKTVVRLFPRTEIYRSSPYEA